MSVSELNKKDIKVPFDTDGNQLAYPVQSWKTNPDGSYAKDQSGRAIILPCVEEWRFDFIGTLKFDRLEIGRSAVRFHFVDVRTGKKYVMFYNDAEECFKKMTKGCVMAKWSFVKKGANFGVFPMEFLDEIPTR